MKRNQKNKKFWKIIYMEVGAIILVAILIILALQKKHLVVSENHKLPIEAQIPGQMEENAETATATPIPIPTATYTPVPTATPYPMSEIETHITDAIPSDIAEYSRPRFTNAWVSSYLIQSAHPDYDNSGHSLIDGNYVTSWQDGVPGDGTGERLTISLPEEKTIYYIEFRMGNWRTTEYYIKNNRPKSMLMEVNGYTYTLNFTDAMIPHYLELNHPITARDFTFTVNSVYKGTEANDCCITEITAFSK